LREGRERRSNGTSSFATHRFTVASVSPRMPFIGALPTKSRRERCRSIRASSEERSVELNTKLTGFPAGTPRSGSSWMPT